MTVQPLAPVIPSYVVPASRQRARSAAARRLPLACPVPVPSAPEGVVYGIARIDSSGSNASLNALARRLNAEFANEQATVP